MRRTDIPKTERESVRSGKIWKSLALAFAEFRIRESSMKRRMGIASGYQRKK
jgi:hypothetical protein